jgi:hypothetical protein
MIVRIRLRLGPTPKSTSVQYGGRAHRGLALATAALLTPAALVTFVLCIWSLAADLGWAGTFGIQNGVFSRWQTWLLVSVLLQAASLLLNRYGANEARSQTP